MKLEALKAVWPRGIPLEEYPRAVALLETVSTAKHWKHWTDDVSLVEAPTPRTRFAFPASESMEEQVSAAEGVRFTRRGRIVAANAKRRSALKPRTGKARCGKALMARVAVLLRAEPCTVARLCHLTRKTERAIRAAIAALGAIEVGEVFRQDGTRNGLLPKEWRLP